MSNRIVLELHIRVSDQGYHMALKRVRRKARPVTLSGTFAPDKATLGQEILRAVDGLFAEPAKGLGK